MRRHLVSLLVAACAALLLLPVACGPVGEDDRPGGGPGGKADTGWVADDSYELGAQIAATLTREATGSYAELATKRQLQEQLVDDQIKYAKNTLKKHGYQLNQLAEEIRTIEVSQEGDLVTLTYRAAVDMIGERHPGAAFPALEDVEQLEIDVPLPQDPVRVYARAGEACARDWSPYTLAEHKYYYYFAPDKEGCTEKVELTQGTVTIERIYPDRTAYPEYDQLLRPLGDGAEGFRAALMPTDDNGMTQFNDHKRMLEDRLGLKDSSEELEDGKITRYTWSGPDGATAEIDLYNPEKYYYWSTFHKALKEYDVVYYDGHSNYGTYSLVDDADYFHDRYQIVMLDGCRSYAYYARQYFKSKGGFDRADMVGTGESAPFWAASRVSGHLLRGLLDGIAAVKRGEEHLAPSWQQIVGNMNDDTYGVLYGAAGVRDNRWQPTPQPE